LSKYVLGYVYFALVFCLYCDILGGKDFIETPYHFIFTPAQQRHCFNVTLINNNRYEATEEFYVNLTSTDENLRLSPSFKVIAIDDEDCKLTCQVGTKS